MNAKIKVEISIDGFYKPNYHENPYFVFAESWICIHIRVYSVPFAAPLEAKQSEAGTHSFIIAESESKRAFRICSIAKV